MLDAARRTELGPSQLESCKILRVSILSAPTWTWQLIMYCAIYRSGPGKHAAVQQRVCQRDGSALPRCGAHTKPRRVRGCMHQ